MKLNIKEEVPYIKVEPFLRWAGGKRWLLSSIDNFLPKKINNYIEPFLGGGSVFFHLANKLKKGILLSDLNEELIITYTAIRDTPDAVIQELKKFKNTKEFYYWKRGKIYTEPHKKAAQFIYLNKTSFNGIYRVNKAGIYNVPYGNRETIDFINKERILNASKILCNTNLIPQDFEISLNTAKRGDLVFVDPPYTVAHENNGFISYNQKIFTLDDQIRLASCLKKLDERGVHFVLTNAKHKEIIKIYKILGNPQEVKRASLIGGKNATRGLISEYIFTNINKK